MAVKCFLLIVSWLMIENIRFAAASDELPETIIPRTFFKTVPNREKAKKTLSDLFAEESGEVSILSDPLSSALTNIFRFSETHQLETLEDLAQRLDMTKDLFEQLSILTFFSYQQCR